MSIRKKFKQNISYRVSFVCFCCVFIALMILCSIIGLGFWNYQFANIKRNLATYTNSVANLLEPDKVQGYLAGEPKDDYYYQIQAIIEALEKEAEINYVYIFYPSKEGITFIWDTDSEYPADISICDPYKGDEYKNISASMDKYPEITAEIYEEESANYGRQLICYRPVYRDDSKNDLIAVIGADLDAEETYQAMKSYEYKIVAIIFLTACVVSWVLRFLISRQLVKPVREISLTAKQLLNDIDSDTETVYTSKFRNHDEIYDLGNSIKGLHHELKDYIKKLSAATAETERIGAELRIAGGIQQAFLRTDYPDNDQFAIYALMDPAKEIGGDFYDFFHLDNDHIVIVVADVSDKGVPASIVMSITKTLIYDHIKTDKDLEKALSHINSLIYRPDEQSMFVTVFAGVLDVRNGELTYVNAGHEPPFISKAGGDFELHKLSPQIAIGVLEDIKYKAETMILEPGDRFFQYTDGLTDATPDKEKGVFFGMDGIKNSLNANKALNSKDLLTAVKADVDAFQANGPQYDDITMLCLEFKQKNKN